MRPRRQRFADYFAMGCGAVALVAYYVFRWDAVAVGALIAGAGVFVWATIRP